MVCIVGNMAQDVRMVESIVVSSPSSLVGFLRVPSLHVLVFIQKTFFVTCSCFFFVSFVFRGRCMICNVQKDRTLLFTKNKVLS